MTDLQYVLTLLGVIILAAIGLAVLEWFDPNPKDWVVKVRLWLKRRGR